MTAWLTQIWKYYSVVVTVHWAERTPVHRSEWLTVFLSVEQSLNFCIRFATVCLEDSLSSLWHTHTVQSVYYVPASTERNHDFDSPTLSPLQLYSREHKKSFQFQRTEKMIKCDFHIIFIKQVVILESNLWVGAQVRQVKCFSMCQIWSHQNYDHKQTLAQACSVTVKATNIYISFRLVWAVCMFFLSSVEALNIITCWSQCV